MSEPTVAGPSRLVAAKVVTGDLELTFADGFKTVFVVGVSDEGDTNLLLTGARGEPMVVDGPTMRFLADPVYAEKVHDRMEELQPTRAELEQMTKDNPPPPEWFAALDNDQNEIRRRAMTEEG